MSEPKRYGGAKTHDEEVQLMCEEMKRMLRYIKTRRLLGNPALELEAKLEEMKQSVMPN
jgi:hypothetical protein